MRNVVIRGFILSLLPLSLAAETAIPSGLLRLGDDSFHSKYAIVVDKTLRKTSLWSFQAGHFEKLKEYSSDHGSVAGDKLVEGDKKTPEGVYFFEEVLEGSAIPYNKYGLKAITMNYPNRFDQRSKKTGHGIWLHAIPDTESLERGSEGCVVVRNNAILELANYIQLNNTPILVYGAASYLSESQIQEKRSGIEELLRTWRTAWIQKDLNTYISFYSDKFRSNSMNKNQWKSYKEKLNSSYQNIFVDFSDPMITEVDGKLTIRSLQHYKSDFHEDFGEKTLYLQKESDGKYKIIAEDWRAVPKEKAQSVILAGRVLKEQRLSSNNGPQDNAPTN